jgi:outer membrane protein assembly factor BamB
VLFGSDDGNLHAADAIVGVLEWFLRTGDRVITSPAVVAVLVYVESPHGNLYAVR